MTVRRVDTISPEERARRAQRAAAQAERAQQSGDTARAKKLLDEARKWLGFHEKGDNGNPFINGQPWCAAFVSKMLQNAGINIGVNSPACDTIASQAANRGILRTSDSYTPQPGDLILFGNSSDYHHVGIVESVKNGKVYTIEGNTSDQCARRCYNLNDGSIGAYVQTFGDKIAGDALGVPKDVGVSQGVSDDYGSGTIGSSGGGSGGDSGGVSGTGGGSGTGGISGTDSGGKADDFDLKFTESLFKSLLSAIDSGSPDEVEQQLKKMFPNMKPGQLKALTKLLTANPQLAGAVKANPALLQQLANNPAMVNELAKNPAAVPQVIAGANIGNQGGLGQFNRDNYQQPADAPVALTQASQPLEVQNVDPALTQEIENKRMEQQANIKA